MDNLPDIISAATAVLALMFSLLSYVKTRKIENQQYKINKEELERISKQKEWSNRANVTVRTFRDKNLRFFVIENEGPLDAYDVDVDKSSIGYGVKIDFEDMLPIEVLPAGESAIFEMKVGYGITNEFRYSWRDANSSFRSSSRTFFFKLSRSSTMP